MKHQAPVQFGALFDTLHPGKPRPGTQAVGVAEGKAPTFAGIPIVSVPGAPKGTIALVKNGTESGSVLKVQAPPVKGETFDPLQDRARLARQYVNVEAIMGDGEWRTLARLAFAVSAPEASVSARLRDMRRAGWVVERRRVEGGNGAHEYRAVKAHPTEAHK